MNVPLIVAGSLAIAGAAIHGGAGEALVMRRLAPAELPPTPFGGPRTTRAMVHVTWHLATVAFLAVGSALVLAGTVLDGDTARGIATAAAAMSTGFTVVAVGLGIAHAGSPRSLWRHPAPVLLTATAALAWWGAL